MMKEKSNSIQNSICSKTTFKNAIEMKTFSVRLRESVTSRPALNNRQKMTQEEMLVRENEEHWKQ